MTTTGAGNQLAPHPESDAMSEHDAAPAAHPKEPVVFDGQPVIDFRDEPGGPAAFFSDVSQPPNVAKVIIHTINSILGDSIVVRTISDGPSLEIWYRKSVRAYMIVSEGAHRSCTTLGIFFDMW